MNWDDGDDSLLSHWQALGQFRARHPSLAMGRHDVLSADPYVFHRSTGAGSRRDEVVVVLAEPGRTRINVSRVFGDNVVLRDAYTGKTTFVSYGMVHVDVGDAGVALLEEVR
jgi:alpha-amylase